MKKKMTKWEKYLLQLALMLLLIAGVFWIKDLSGIDKKVSDRIGCSDIQKIFPEKKIKCKEIQKRFN